MSNTPVFTCSASRGVSLVIPVSTNKTLRIHYEPTWNNSKNKLWLSFIAWSNPSTRLLTYFQIFSIHKLPLRIKQITRKRKDTHFYVYCKQEIFTDCGRNAMIRSHQTTLKLIGLMVYLHCQIGKLIPIWTANQMTTLYRTFHTAESDSDSNHKCQLQECNQDQNPQWWM